MPRARVVAAGAVVVAIVVGVIWYVRRSAHDEVHSVVATKAVARPTAVSIPRSPDYTSAGSDGSGNPGSPGGPGGSGGSDESEHIGSADSYPVNLDALRAR